ncbi:MAG: EutN/CcmL family microcompartment protein [Acidobacteria bacterium]|nr:EutN/CcmL family microcompartment protein [Acidobacteriota bacterium]
MLLGRVEGHVWATRKLDVFQGKKLMVVQPLDEGLNPVSRHIVAVDTVDAGIGDVVCLATSKEAAVPMAEKLIPVDAAIVGIVDRVDR